jgi:hypothetical protein
LNKPLTTLLKTGFVGCYLFEKYQKQHAEAMINYPSARKKAIPQKSPKR